MSKVIVTGAAGFIGSSLAETLLQQGITVVGVDQVNDYYDITLKRKNLAALAQYQNFQLIEADIQHLDWEDLLKGVSVVYHQAAKPGYGPVGASAFGLYRTKY